MKKILLSLLLFSFFYNLNAQNSPNVPPCTSPEISQFDFWIGDWQLTWNDTSHGTNSIRKIMEGCTVQESFNDPSMKYSGSSWSVYNPKIKMWQQTWVDNQGGYIVLKGEFSNGMMTLSTDPRKLQNGTEIISRMVFYDIASDKFDWKWESTKDDGKSWQTDWLIHYQRKNG